MSRARQQFVAWMAERFVGRTDMTRDEAAAYASDILDSMLPIFAADGWAWDRHDAEEIADTDLSYWEQGA